MVKIFIDEKEYDVPEGITLIQACELAGIEIPRFCYHDRLKIAGNCRMCLVEMIGGPPKPIASCATDVMPNMKISTKSPMVKKAREGVMEFLLANHPLDCPICDQGGECDLQDQAIGYGKGYSDYFEDKRAVSDKDFGPLIKTAMTRCIHCTRCVRFATEIAGAEELGTIGRGEDMEIKTYLGKMVTSELSGNMIDLCPVGALTSKPYAFKARPWDIVKYNSIDVMDAVGSNIRIDVVKNKVERILPYVNEEINQEWISDKTRFAYDGLYTQRIDKVYVNSGSGLQPASWHEAFAAIEKKIDEKKGNNKIAALAGDLCDVESVFALKNLLLQLGCEDYDCRPEGSIMKYENRSDYIFNSGISGIDETDFILFVGVNPRYEATIINSRIRARAIEGNITIANIGVANDLTYDVEQLGNDFSILHDIYSGKNKITKKLASAKKPMIIVGEATFLHKNSQAACNEIMKLVKKYCINSKSWNGFNVLHNAAGRVGALDMEFVGHKSSTAKILTKADNKQLDIAFLLNYDKKDVRKFKDVFTIYIGSNADRGAMVADVILPAAVYTEKFVSYVNTEGKIQRTTQAAPPPGQALPEWLIVNNLAKFLKLSNFVNHKELYKNLCDEFPQYADIDNVMHSEELSNYEGSSATGEMLDLIVNYYMTNAIARNSKTMSRCAKLLGHTSNDNLM
jgi:NADH-quinone oxidoreductase subunit G